MIVKKSVFTLLTIASATFASQAIACPAQTAQKKGSMHHMAQATHGVEMTRVAAPSAGMHAHSMTAPVANPNAPIAEGVSIEKCWVRLSSPELASGLFFDIANKGKTAVRLTGFTTPVFAETMLHESYDNNGMMGMRHVGMVEVPAGGMVQFKPGGFHGMMNKPAANLKAGDQVTFEFILADGSKVPTSCSIKSIKARSFEDK